MLLGDPGGDGWRGTVLKGTWSDVTARRNVPRATETTARTCQEGERDRTKEKASEEGSRRSGESKKRHGTTGCCTTDNGALAAHLAGLLEAEEDAKEGRAAARHRGWERSARSRQEGRPKVGDGHLTPPRVQTKVRGGSPEVGDGYLKPPSLSAHAKGQRHRHVPCTKGAQHTQHTTHNTDRGSPVPKIRSRALPFPLLQSVTQSHPFPAAPWAPASGPLPGWWAEGPSG